MNQLEKIHYGQSVRIVTLDARPRCLAYACCWEATLAEGN